MVHCRPIPWFMTNTTRLDIAFAVNKLATYTANPSLQHARALKRILRYLSGTRNYGMTYKKSTTTLEESPNSLPYPKLDTRHLGYAVSMRSWAKSN